MNIHRALSDIADIRSQLNRNEVYRGFRSGAVGASVLVLLVGAYVQRVWIVHPAEEVQLYLAVWISVAALSAVMAGIEMLARAKVSQNKMVARMHWALVRQIAPSFFVGIVLTGMIAVPAMEQASIRDSMAWALPGVWSLIYGLGLFGCQQHLPIAARGVALYFLIAGALILGYASWTKELAEWQMVASFGVGQTYLASVLFWKLERRRGQTES